MIDIPTTRKMATQTHTPLMIFAMLFGLALASALLAGHSMAGGTAHSWLHTVGFAVIIAATVYVILNLEFPRLGVIRVEDFDQALRDLLESMK